jgi:hypothetical protein
MADPLNYESRVRRQSDAPGSNGIGCGLTSLIGSLVFALLVLGLFAVGYQSTHPRPMGGPEFRGAFIELASIVPLLVSTLSGVFGVVAIKREEKLARGLCISGLAIAAMFVAFACYLIFG